ncbi:hypothetical protein QE364_003865 [Nocardioides zeae]|uniref:Uncharacterized protein n=2 Tax=Nocardioides zeae TaxID=1457234 RepID=A0ACC6IN22_9ACTN|nr:ATP-binding protein [Nocardioides zeae]MDQ1105941.1 hypothetical protein [Nocardioides zeae]MDR6174413.1 hypothetical protein [Nocardioides zeae]MDR6212134.1 hypothetical protein [Nocardioides zeae]
MTANPFKPTAGADPPVLVGRGDLLDELADTFVDGPGSPGRITIFTGVRGVGKTVMLNETEDMALRHGWLALTETATDGLAQRLDVRVARILEERVPRPRRRITGATLPGLVGVTTQLTPEIEDDLRQRVTALLDDLERHGTGLLITIDEVHRGASADLRAVAALTQHLIREGREFALAMAGLPSAVAGLLSDDVLTFLRRASRHALGGVAIEEVEAAISSTMAEAGRTLEPEAARLAAAGTSGYPFLIQLVGHQLWRASRGATVATVAHAKQAVEAARRRMGSLVHETALADLSDVDKTFLVAMSHDRGPSRMGEIARRMRVQPQYANTYKQRLIEAGVIVSAGHGKVDYALPYLREYLREHAASLGLAPGASGLHLP